MTARTAKLWLEAMAAEGVDIDAKKMEALDEAMAQLVKGAPIAANMSSDNLPFCPLCNTQIAVNNQKKIGRYCHWCGQRINVRFKKEGEKDD